MQTISILVKGKVQGVFFRKFTVKAAKKFGVTGFVENTESGDVYIEATGSETAIEEMIKWCNSGSPWSKVEEVIVDKLPFRQFEGFDIRYR